MNRALSSASKRLYEEVGLNVMAAISEGMRAENGLTGALGEVALARLCVPASACSTLTLVSFGQYHRVDSADEAGAYSPWMARLE